MVRADRSTASPAAGPVVPTGEESTIATHLASGPSRARMLLLLGGGVGLLAGLWSGLARAGLHRPIGPYLDHGILMVLGFLGTLIALERAVALGTRWAYAAPACSGLAVVWLLVGLPRLGAGLLFGLAGVLVVAGYGVLLHRRYETSLALMAAGALAWVLAAVLWTLGWSPVRLGPVLAAFLVLTIVGERLELSRLRRPSAAARRRLLAAVAVFASGTLVTLVDWRAGLLIGGVGLVAQAGWLARNDIARATIHRPGLPRFAAACMLSGYVWLAASGLLWVAMGAGVRGPLLYDAALHTLFLGFVFSMVMGHAPIILPAVLRRPLPHEPVAWLPLGLLHLSVGLRVAADLVGSTWARGWTAHGNVAAMLLFVAVSVRAARRAGRRVPTPGDPLRSSASHGVARDAHAVPPG